MISAVATRARSDCDPPLPDIVSERHASAHRATNAVAEDVLIGGIPRYGKAPASCWRERVDNAGASFAWRAPSSSRPFEGARVLTGYCTLVKGFGNSGWIPHRRDRVKREKHEKGWRGPLGPRQGSLTASPTVWTGSCFHRSTASR